MPAEADLFGQRRWRHPLGLGPLACKVWIGGPDQLPRSRGRSARVAGTMKSAGRAQQGAEQGP